MTWRLTTKITKLAPHENNTSDKRKATGSIYVANLYPSTSMCDWWPLIRALLLIDQAVIGGRVSFVATKIMDSSCHRRQKSLQASNKLPFLLSYMYV